MVLTTMKIAAQGTFAAAELAAPSHRILSEPGLILSLTGPSFGGAGFFIRAPGKHLVGFTTSLAGRGGRTHTLGFKRMLAAAFARGSPLAVKVAAQSTDAAHVKHSTDHYGSQVPAWLTGKR
jgi:hypothetical protein